MICSERFLYEPNALLVINRKTKGSPVPYSYFFNRKCRQLRRGHGATCTTIENVTESCATIASARDSAQPIRPTHSARCGRSVRGGTPLTQPSRATSVVANVLRGQQSVCGSFMRWEPARLAHRSIWGLYHCYFPWPLASDVDHIERKCNAEGGG